MREEKILILKSNQSSFEKFYSEKMQKENVDIYSVYRFDNGILRWIMLIWIQVLHMPFKCIWYGKWKKQIRSYDKVILFDRILGFEVIKYIKKHNKECRLIFWYWNIICKKMPESYRKLCEIWSFDTKDCIQYGLSSNIQFYFPVNVLEKEETCDIFFVGKEKGRLQHLQELKDYFTSKNLSAEFWIVSKKCKNDMCIKHEIDYDMILNQIRKSKCILEIVQEGQDGLSARALEALFYNKKLITNCKTIKYQNFYHPDNIFILGEDDMAEILTFLNKPYYHVNENIKRQFEYEAWLDNFNHDIRTKMNRI